MKTRQQIVDRFLITVWKIDKLLEYIRTINSQLDSMSELKALNYPISSRAINIKYSVIEEMSVKKEILQDEKKVREFELQLARFELSTMLGNMHNIIRPGLIHLLQDYYIEALAPPILEKKYGKNYMITLQKTTRL